MPRFLPLFLASVALPLPVLAQQAPPADQPAQPAPRGEPGSDDLHDEIVVTAAGVDRLDIVAGTSVISGTELQRESAGQVGDVLDSLPGVAASGFAPGASRPVLRGFGGERVRVLTDGIGSLDASGASADHAVAVDPLIAERIEVLRGPAVLLYGSQAIGGAVNVITKRIPPRLPTEALHVDALAGLDTASNLYEGGLSLDAPLGAGFAAHLDASYRNTDDLAIPGYAASDALRADLFAQADEEEAEGHADEAAELREAADARGVLENSWTEALSLGAGLGWFSGENDFGVSFDYYDTSYGVPARPGAGHAHEEGEGEEEEEAVPVSIGLKRYRADLRGRLDLGEGLFDELRVRGGWSDYTHTEFEGDEVGIVFDVQGVEGRAELVQSRRGPWGGSSGLQYSHVDFEAIGAEAFVPPSVTETFALFTLQELDYDRFGLEAGARYEQTSVAADTLGLSRDFGTFSAALGGNVALADELRLGANLSRTERAPSAQELFSDGPHIATQQFELGDPSLAVESSWGVEGYLRGEIGRADLSATVYRNWFDNFIYLAETGAEEDGLPVSQFRQQGADQWGFEAEASVPLVEHDAFSLLAELRADYTRATLDDGDPVPRIPPFSLAGALEGRWRHFDLRGEVEWNAAQNRTAPLETPTEAFTMVNVSLAWHPFEGADNITVLAEVANLFDAEGRRAASFTKDFVPMAGRNFRLTARASF